MKKRETLFIRIILVIIGTRNVDGFSVIHRMVVILECDIRPNHAMRSMLLGHHAPCAWNYSSSVGPKMARYSISSLGMICQIVCARLVVSQRTISISMDRHGNCFLVNLILMIFTKFLNVFSAVANCSTNNRRKKHDVVIISEEISFWTFVIWGCSSNINAHPDTNLAKFRRDSHRLHPWHIV